jgi:hypothetical protein
MSGARSEPPWDFFHDASIASLQSFELSRLNQAANIRREIGALLDQWVSENSQALLARWVREQRGLPCRASAQAQASTSPQSALPLEAALIPVLLPRRAEPSQRPAKAVRTSRR